jgi:hypothetical protein
MNELENREEVVYTISQEPQVVQAPVENTSIWRHVLIGLAVLLVAIIIWKILKGLPGFFVSAPEVANTPIASATQVGLSVEELSSLMS